MTVGVTADRLDPSRIASPAIGAPPPDRTIARIVSTSPSITEMLFALGLGDRVVGVSRFCRVPDQVRALPKIGTFLRPDAELIARLRPTLVVLHKSQGGIEQRLSSLKLPFITVERGSLASVYSTARAIGAAAGVPERAAAWTADLDARLDAIRRAVAGRPPRRVLIVVGRRTGMLSDLVAVGHDSYLSDVIAIAGGINVLQDQTLPAYPRISMETVIRLDPDVIVDAADMGESIEERRQRQRQTEAMWQRQPLIASSGARVHGAMTDAFVVPGPRVVDAARLLASWLHGVEIR